MADGIRIGRDEVACHFAEREDPRSEIHLRHPLVSVIVIALLAVLAGSSGPTAVAKWALMNEGLLKGWLPLPNGIPRKDVFRRVLATLPPAGTSRRKRGLAGKRRGTTFKCRHPRPGPGSVAGRACGRSGWPCCLAFATGRRRPIFETSSAVCRWESSASRTLSEPTGGLRTRVMGVSTSPYREDESRIREHHLRENFAWLNRVTLSLLKQHPGKDRLAMKRRCGGWNDDFLLETLTGTTI